MNAIFMIRTMESLANLPLDINDDAEDVLDREDKDNEDLDSDMVEVTHEDGENPNETEDADKKKTPIWRKPQKKKGGKKGGGGKQKSKSNKKKDTKAAGDSATSTDVQGTNQNVSRYSQVIVCVISLKNEKNDPSTILKTQFETTTGSVVN